VPEEAQKVLVEVLSRRNALLGTIVAGLTRTAAAESPGVDQEAELAVVAPDGQATSMQLANDLVARLGGSARHLHMEGSRGVVDAVGHLYDRLRPVAAILPSTALAFMEQTGSPSQDAHANRYIAQLDVLTFQVLASRRITNLRQLAGQKVGLGPRGSPTQTTASVLLDQSSVRVDPLYLDHEQACAAVIRGEISAMMLLAPKPARLFLDVDASDGVRFIPVAEPDGHAAGFLPTQILPADYPMIAAGDGRAQRGVKTVTVPTVLGCFGWAAQTANFIALARLAELVSEHGSGLPGFDMTASVSGWRRFAPVEDWLTQGRSGSIQDYAATDTRPAVSQMKPAAPTRAPAATPAPPALPPPPRVQPEPRSQPRSEPDPRQKEKLFQEFLHWRHNS
jgi:hypothetical protein